MSEAISYDERAETLEQRRVEKMAGSAHAYVRGATADFYAWLAELGSVDVPNSLRRTLASGRN